MAAEPVHLSAEPLTRQQLLDVARGLAPVQLDGSVRALLAERRQLIDDHVASGEPIYGITTGFGALADVQIGVEDISHLQHNLLRSHAAAVDEPLDDEVVRAMMLLRARTLAAGVSGVRPEIVEQLVGLLDSGWTPVVPSRGSVGASGDLAQLAHIGLALTGEGQARHRDGTHRSADAALADAGLASLELAAKEGLALVNGTEGMTALAALAVTDAAALLRAADVTAAMTVEGGHGTDRPFAAELHELRAHPGQLASAGNLRALLADSDIVASHRQSRHAVQDPYSLRCTPQVHGAARDTLAFLATVVDRELASVTDNPVLLSDGRVESTGNFHGAPLGYALDALAVALVDAASISERRTFWLMDEGQRRGLPAFLSPRPGLSSGYMLAQYTQAALVSEAKTLAHPASVDSIPTSGSQEDHVAMGWWAGLKARGLLQHLARVLSVEALCGAQALDLRAPVAPAAATAAARDAVRSVAPFLDTDRALAGEIAAMTEAVRDGRLEAAASGRLDVLR